MKYTLYIFVAIMLIYSDSSIANEKKLITTSIVPVYSIVKMISGDLNDVRLLISKNKNSVHEFKLRPSDIKLLMDSDLIFYIDDSLEAFMPKIKSLLRKKRHSIQQVVNLMIYSDIKVLPKDSKEECSYISPKGITVNYDAHLWLDPIIVIEMMKVITRKLSKIDHAHAPIYEANLQKSSKAIMKLHREIASLSKPIRKNEVFVFHDAYRYFSCRYSLGNITPIQKGDGYNLSTKSMINALKASGNKPCFLFDTHTNKHFIENEIKHFRNNATLDPTGSNLKNINEDSYIEIMRKVALTFMTCSTQE